MSSPASIKKHPLHPMLVGLPIGLWIFSLVADVLRRITGDSSWELVALYTMGGGIVGALIAAVPGAIDLIAIWDPRVKRLGVFHMLINLAAVGVFSYDLFLRWNGHAGDLPLALSIIGVLSILASGWLGGEMVYVHGAAVEPKGRELPPHDGHTAPIGVSRR
jgi:uncharacterized membrane protein